MSTAIRPELSKKSKYWISKHRYYELKHFCLQYPEWQKEKNDILLALGSASLSDVLVQTEYVDSTGDKVTKLEKLNANLDLVEKCAKEADIDICKYLLMGVTKNYSCDYMIVKLGMPCGRDMYYDRYRKFFWLLAQRK